MKKLLLWFAVSLVFCGLYTNLEASEPRFIESELKFIEPAGAYRYSTTIPDKDPGFCLVPKAYTDSFNPAEPIGKTSRNIWVEATPGEYEPLTFIIYATRDLRQVDVQVSDVTSDVGAPIPTNAIDVRRVVRSPQRIEHNFSPDTAEVTNRFLARWKPTDIPKGEFRQIWLTVHVPERINAGSYLGEIKVKSAGLEATLDLHVRVLPFKLVQPKDKGLGLYYSARQVTERNIDILRTQLAEMRLVTPNRMWSSSPAMTECTIIIL